MGADLFRISQVKLPAQNPQGQHHGNNGNQQDTDSDIPGKYLIKFFSVCDGFGHNIYGSCEAVLFGLSVYTQEYQDICQREKRVENGS
jgi:hypothetical protein